MREGQRMIFSKKKRSCSGQLSELDIQEELRTESGLSIISCVDFNKNIHASSIDITPTIVCMSVKTGMLQTVYVKKSQTTNSYYTCVRPHDTILIISNEFVSLPEYISGYVTSRVSNVVNGFGHICTTIDPNWKGALLIGLSNPTNRNIKIDIGTSTRTMRNGQSEYITDKKPLATLTFHYLSGATFECQDQHSSMRVDLLKEKCYKGRSGIKNCIMKVIHPNQKKFTDYFFEYLESHKNELCTKQGWLEFLNEFSIFNIAKRTTLGSRFSKTASDYIVKESIFNRIKITYENHKTLFGIIITIIGLVVYKYISQNAKLMNEFEDLEKVDGFLEPILRFLGLK